MCWDVCWFFRTSRSLESFSPLRDSSMISGFCCFFRLSSSHWHQTSSPAWCTPCATALMRRWLATSTFPFLSSTPQTLKKPTSQPQLCVGTSKSAGQLATCSEGRGYGNIEIGRLASLLFRGKGHGNIEICRSASHLFSGNGNIRICRSASHLFRGKGAWKHWNLQVS